MALLPHGFFPRSMFDMDQWYNKAHHGASTLDLFDPFDELDHTLSRNMQWLNKPEFMQPMLPMLPKIPQKYRIIVDCVGYSPNSIKTDVVGHKLVVSGREEVKHEHDEDFSIKEFKKTYKLPEHSETDKLVSFMTGHGQLVIEVPLKETELHKIEDLFPSIIDTANGGKAVSLKFNVPENIKPEEVSVSIKDRDIIVKAEHKTEKPDGISKFYYYKRTTLPENTDFHALKCSYDNHKISIEAPLSLDMKSYKKVPIEHKKQAAINQK